jgi:hypothetical protein
MEELIDGGGLVAAGLVVAAELEIHDWSFGRRFRHGARITDWPGHFS